MWVIDDDKKDGAIIDEINRMDDRAAAIIASGYLERGLEQCLRAEFRDDKKLLNKFFRGMGPLATFSARIDLGFLLQIYEEHWHKCFHAIRRIRNLFSHDPNPMNFKSPEIKNEARDLVDPKQMAAHFHTTFEKIAGPGNSASADMKPLLDSLLMTDDSLRMKYLCSAQLCLFTLKIKRMRRSGEDGKLEFRLNPTSPETS